MSKKYVFSFYEGDGKNKRLLGGKGANLCEMTQIGLNVPPGFVISTEACLAYLDSTNGDLPEGLMDDVRKHMAELERATGKKFGDPENPLLVSVRSGSALSMPGMMDTILNLGLNSQTLPGLINQTNNERFAYDACRRFIQLFGKVAMGISDEYFDQALEAIKIRSGAISDVDLTAEDLKEIVELFHHVVEEQKFRPFPEDVWEQLGIAIKAVFSSWMGKRAVDYRRQFNITTDLANGTAVNIVAMVFGNMGNDSGTGVGFTRDPATGENKMFGEYLVNAQGEDVVAGIRTPRPIQAMAQEMPGLYKQLEALRDRLEKHYREIQDFEFTIEKGILYCLQTRNGKMNATAMVRTSVEMVEEGLLTKEEALLRINPEHLEQLLYPGLDPNFEAEPLAQGLPASPGAASGKCIFDADSAERLGRAGERVILVREETKPEDIHGFFASQGILTSRGGKTSHAAVVARGMGKPCVAGAEGIHVDTVHRWAVVGDHVLHEGDLITIDGATGNVYLGEIPTVEPEFSPQLHTLLGWADEFARLGVMANADTPEAAEKAREFGAVGIGLCRTERMFNAVDRLPLVIDMILADTVEERKAALNKLLPIQKSDFFGIFKAMSPYPVTIRLLDPPIHEFLPTEAELQIQIEDLKRLRDTAKLTEKNVESLKLIDPQLHSNYMAQRQGMPAFFASLDLAMIDAALAKKELMFLRARVLKEVNPMLGHRGVRLAVSFPEIYEMQIRAILEAAAECIKEGIEAHAEIMVPQVCAVSELLYCKTIVSQVQQEVEELYKLPLNFKFGTMVEVVRACITADELAKESEFFSFGTNDLTQAAFSFSREDAENKFLPFYQQQGIIKDNPFEALDIKGVGSLMKLAVQGGRSVKPNLKIGICGEHGGHPGSIRLCHHVGLDYVSCSGPRVPIARLAAAHATMLEKSFDI
ncbi:MAG: pyruvate, phosphate dikinase [Desulfomonile tiedjei]|uniref:Pyruvate, phosphate dikinase n=1 Tax=Desulfomonile tiedjei TaxID=2358 RepID=A0A9D6UYX1_9BACT|nr:pyruvate, phosphate dikinase [Desulfomonile tiedjei]